VPTGVARPGLDDIVALLGERALDRAGLLRELAARGHPGLGQCSINVLMPWAAAQGLIVGLPDGRYRAAQPPATVDGAWPWRRWPTATSPGTDRQERQTSRRGPACR
jgi:hypothetical protein